MKLYEAGDKSKAICEHCKSLVPTTFMYRDVPFDDGSGVVKDILVAVCDICDKVVAIPAQSTPAIKRARENAEVTLEVSVSARDLAVLDYAAWRIDDRATARFRKSLIAHFLRRLEGDPEAPQRLAEKIKQIAATRKISGGIQIPRKRLSCKISPATDARIDQLMRVSGLSKSDLVKAVIGEIEDALVRQEAPADLALLRDVAAVVNA
ncbi:MAG: hypothetical protein ACXIVE_17680 [Salinarimonas sp.]